MLQRSKRFDKVLFEFRKNPQYQKLKEIYLNNVNFKITSARKILNMVKYTIKGDVKKSSIISLKKQNEIIEKYDNVILEGQSLEEMNKQLDIFVKNKNISKKKIDKKQINTLLDNLDQSKKYVLEIKTDKETKIYAINNNSKGFANVLMVDYYGPSKNTTSSDDWAEENYDAYTNITILPLEINNIRNMNRNVGKFEFYINHEGVDLSEYQIYNKNQIINNTNCLIYSLEKEGIKQEYIKQLILKFSSIEKVSSNDICLKTFNYIKQKDFQEVSNIVKRIIIITTYSEPHQIKKEYKPNIIENDNPINLAIYKNHIFNNNTTKYKKYAVLNYESLKDKKDWFLYSEKAGKKNDGKLLSSFELIRLLDNNNYLEKKPIDIDLTDNIEILNTNDLLINLEDDQKEFEYKEKRKTNYNIYFADLENINKTNTCSIPFLSGIISEYEDEPYIYTGLDCIEKMLDYIIIRNNDKYENIVYFHNMKYDFSLMKSKINIINICEKEGSIYSVKILYKDINITFKDSYKVFNKKLSDFTEAFNLPEELSKKEAINYEYYNEETILDKYASIKVYAHGIKEKEKEIFYDNIKPFIIKKNKFNHMDYYRYYLKYDVLVLKNGMIAFNKCMIDTFGKPIFDFLTISSYADDYFKNRNVYNGVYEVKGGLKKFLSKAVYGGRVNVCSDFKKKEIHKRINDFDGVSLYPSAIYRLCNEYGLPLGKAKRIKDTNILDKDYFVVDIKIKKINKKQQNPFIAIKTKTSIQYTNDIIDDSIITTVDKFTLEDYINFHKIEYDILDGVYWDEGFNNKFICIKDVFEERLKQKSLKSQEGNIKQELYKLILNSAYGKTLLKSSCKKNFIVNKKDFNTYVYNNFNTIEYCKKISDNQFLVTQVELDDSYNRAHCGIAILSMSKRIMNEVMDTASTNNINIYYQDTDSMHIDDNQIINLSKLYEDIYNRKLIGKQLGQFHSDFKHVNEKANNVVATKSIFLGKKAYIDFLEGTLTDGKKEYCLHYRLKGVNEIAVINKAKEYKNNNMNDNIYNLYKDLANDKDIEFILNPEDKPSFKFTSEGVYKIETNKFIRNINFKTGESNIDDENYYN